MSIPVSDNCKPRLPDDIYASLVEHLFGTVGAFAATVMASLVLAVTTYLRSPAEMDHIFAVCGSTHIFVALLRVSLFFAFRRRMRQAGVLATGEMQKWEAAYALVSVAWMAAVGMTGYFGMRADDPVLNSIVTTVVIGASGGIAGRNAARPAIVGAQVFAGLVPYGYALVLMNSPYYYALLVLVVFLGFSVRSSTNAIYAFMYTALSSSRLNKMLAGRFDTALNNMSNGLVMFGSDLKVEIVNSRFFEIFNVPLNGIREGASLADLISACGGADDGLDRSSDGDLVATLGACLVSASELKVEAHTLLGRTIEFCFHPKAEGGSVVVIEDISERDRSTKLIAYMAHFDDLTALPNRASFKTKLGDSLAAMANGGSGVAVLSIDLDMFKEVNDTLGHPVGDLLLVEVGKRLKSIVRPHDFVARLGGDEFVILQADVHIGDSSDCLASRVIAEIGKPYAIEGQEIVIGASIGISLAGPGCDSVDDLLKNADMALYAAKDDGRSVWRFFKREMEVAARTRRETEIDLRRALDQGEFSVFFQPIVNTDSGKVVCCEALVRWFHPQRGMIPPCQFIELAERTGMIVELGGVILAKACKAAMKWPEDISVAVNLSAVQFQRGVVIEQVMTALVKSGLPAKRLEVEITESLALRDMRATKQVLEQLRGIGVKVALDDFGTGYSSLSYLNQIPFDKIKIDRSFVLAIHENKMSRSLIGMVSNLAKTMDREMVVEGVETEDDLAVLRDLGVRDIQGYLFSKPRPSGELMDMLEKGVAKSAPVKFRVVA